MKSVLTGRADYYHSEQDRCVLARLTIATLFFGSLCVLLTACSFAEPKEYEEMPDIRPSVQVLPVWVTPVGELSERAHRQLPAVTHNNTVYVAGATGDVAALSLETGKARWTVSLKEQVVSGPAIGAGKLFIATNNAELIALDSKNGRQVWRSQMSSLVLSQPHTSGDKLFVQTNDEKLYALDISTGKRIWAEGRDVPSLSLRGTASPVTIGDSVIAGFANGRLVAFDIQNGDTRWESTIATPRGRTDLERIVDIDGLLAEKNDILYVSSFQGRIAAVSVTDGRIVWNRDMSSYTGISLQAGLVCITDAEGFVWALDRKTGATLWRQDKLKDRDLSAPVAVSGTIVVADRGGYVHWLSMDDGAFMARENLEQVHDDAIVNWGDSYEDTPNFGVTIYPAVSGNALLVRNDMGDLSLFRITPSAVKKP